MILRMAKKKKKHAALIKMYIDGSVTVRLAVNTHLSCVRYFFNMDYKCNPLNPDKQIFFQNDSPCSLPLSVCHLILVFSAFFSAKKDTDERGRTEPKQSSNTFGCQKAKHFQAEEQLFLLSKHSRHLFYQKSLTDVMSACCVGWCAAVRLTNSETASTLQHPVDAVSRLHLLY